MYKVVKQISISASHQLCLPYESGCNNVHGHNYKIEVCLMAEQLNNQGMIMDFSTLKDILNRLVVKKFDHKHLNNLIAFTTAEFLAHCIYMSIEEELIGICQTNDWNIILDFVRVWETDSSYAEYSV